MQQFYTRHQVAALAGIDKNTYYKHSKAGTIPAPTVPVGRRFVYTEEQKDVILDFYRTWEPWSCMRKKA